MSDADKKVECGEHGRREPAFVCQHLIDGTAAGFHWGQDDEDPDRVCPDAWCDACEAVRRSEGGWNDRSEAFARVRLLCDGCYERVRERNWIQDDAAFDTLLGGAVEYLERRQAELSARYSLGSCDRYHWDQDTGQLAFSQRGRVMVVADIQFVGTCSTRSDTWLWSWANPSFVEPVKRDIRKVRALGEAHRYLKLASARWPAGEPDGWDMTAVAAYVLNASGAFRSPHEHGCSFMVITRVDRAQ